MSEHQPSPSSSDQFGAKSWGCLNRLLGLFLIFFSVMLAGCAILSGASGLFLLLIGEGAPSVFPLMMSILLGLGTLYFLVLGVIGLFRNIPALSQDGEQLGKGDRVFAAVFGGCAGVILGGVLGVMLTFSGSWENGVGAFGVSIFLLSLVSYAFPDLGAEISGEIYQPAFRVVIWCIGKVI